MRIGIFGGTFDPIHHGHLVIAQTALSELELQKVYFVPAGVPPHKMNENISPAATRLRLVQLAIEDNPAFAISRIEIDREGPSYMAQTLELLRKSLSAEDEMFLILGADNLCEFHSWHQPEKILRLAKVAAYPRYEFDVSDVPESLLRQVRIFHAPRMEISSSYIRDLVRQGRSIRYLVPDRIAHEIEANGIYSPDENSP